MKSGSLYLTGFGVFCILLSGVRCSSAQSVPACDPAWTAGMAVTVGELVSYNDQNYRALQAEASAISNWQPPNVPALWTLVGACSAGTTTTPPPPPPPPPPTNPTPGIGNEHVLIGYWHDFSNGSVNLPLAQVSSDFDVIDVAFGGTTTDTSTISFDVDTVDIESEAQFIADVATLQSKGKKVILSIGGANGNVALQTSQDVTNFVNSVTALIQKYGFNGIDIDIENNSFSLISGDNDYTKPKTPTTVNMISALHQLATKFPGFFLSFAPQVSDVQEANVAYTSSFGDQLPLVWGCRDIMAVLQVQDYNTGGTNALDGNTYTEGTADFDVAMTELLLHGFTLANGQTFPGFPASQVALGVPASNSAGGGFTAPSAVKQALNYLVNGVPFGGKYVLQNPAGYPGLRGLMTWSINWDVVNGAALSSTVSPFIESLPPISDTQ